MKRKKQSVRNQKPQNEVPDDLEQADSNINENEIRFEFYKAITLNDQNLIENYLQFMSKSEKPFVKEIIEELGGRWVFHAVKNNNYILVEQLLELGAEPDELHDGLTALHVAAENGDHKMVKILLAYMTEPFKDTHIFVGIQHPQNFEDPNVGQIHSNTAISITRESSPREIAKVNGHESIEILLREFQIEKLKAQANHLKSTLKASKQPKDKLVTPMQSTTSQHRFFSEHASNNDTKPKRHTRSNKK